MRSLYFFLNDQNCYNRFVKHLRWREKSYPWVLFTFFLVIYLLYPTNLPYIDGLYFAYHVEHMPLSDTFHPHHLLFLTITQFLFGLLKTSISSIRGLTFFQSTNSILGALTLIYVYQLLLKLFKSPSAAFLATFFYGASFGFWHHATDANVYISFNFFLTIILSRFLLDKNLKSKRSIIINSLLTASATLIHQLGIFLLIPFSAFLLAPDENGQRSAKPLVIFLLTYFAAVFIPYLLVFIFVISEGQPSVALFAKWVTAYGSNRTFWPILYHDVYYVISVITRSQFNSIFHVIPMEKILYKGGQLEESQGLINLFSFIYAMILVLIIERIHFINFRARNEEKELYRKVLAWMMPFFVFFMFFAPENYFYRIFYLLPLIIFGGGLIESSTIKDKKRMKPFLFILVIFTFIFNAWDGIIPESRIKENPYIVDAAMVNKVIGRNNLIVFADSERYLASIFRYYFDRECLHAMSRMRYRDETPEALEAAKNETARFLNEKYSRVYFSSTAVRMGVQTYYFSLNNFPEPHPAIMLLDKDQIIQIGQVLTTATYFRVEIEEIGNQKKERYVLLPEIDKTWEPWR